MSDPTQEYDFVADIQEKLLAADQEVARLTVKVEAWEAEGARLAELEGRMRDVLVHLPMIFESACRYNSRMGIYGTADLPRWMFDLIPEGIDHEERPKDVFAQMADENQRLRARVAELEQR